MTDKIEPIKDCTLCPRLANFLAENRIKFPHFHNAPVPSFGGLDATILVVGLAPGLKGANATGRPFTGDYAGDLLYETLQKKGYASGFYQKRAEDGFTLHNVRITNAVRCVPPQNKPTGDEVLTCRPYLVNEMNAMQERNLKIILSLGKISHDTVLKTFNLKLSQYPFGHGAVHSLPNGLYLVDSYHCSRYNVNTGRLTAQMFEDVFDCIATL